MKQVTFNQNFDTFMRCHDRMVQVVKENGLLPVMVYPTGDRDSFRHRTYLEVMRNWYNNQLDPAPYTEYELEIGRILENCNILIGNARPGDAMFDELTRISVDLLDGCFNNITNTSITMAMAYLSGYANGYISYDPQLHLVAQVLLNSLNYTAVTTYLENHPYDNNCRAALSYLEQRFGKLSLNLICEYARGKTFTIAD